MKKRIKIGLFLILFLGLLLFIVHPTYVISEAEVHGEIHDENGNPISNATISRISEKISYHPQYGYEVRTPYISQIGYSDNNGRFKLNKKGKIIFTWLFKLTDKCDLDFEITKEGYKTYKSYPYEWQIENGQDLCNQTVFYPKIILKLDEENWDKKILKRIEQIKNDTIL